MNYQVYTLGYLPKKRPSRDIFFYVNRDEVSFGNSNSWVKKCEIVYYTFQK